MKFAFARRGASAGVVRCTMLTHMSSTLPDAQPRIVWCEQLIGSATVCQLLRIDRSTLVRRIARGEIAPLAQLDGPNGAYVFDRGDFPAVSR